MITFLVVFTTMLTVVAMMAVGVMMGRNPITGSCGGMAALGMEVECEICHGDKTICEDDDARNARIAELAAQKLLPPPPDTSLAYDATKK